mmetsp:Transcript_17958/g.39282  ORF Transcript_17958/g.39282 Transcript_17958/m.39282 type:complete len:463 (+) Transcript_17958:62-1450(+)
MMISTSKITCLLLLVCSTAVHVSAFVPATHSIRESRAKQSASTAFYKTKTTITTWSPSHNPARSTSIEDATALFMSSNDGGMEGTGELVTALARLDEQWKLSTDRRRIGEWQKLVIEEQPTDYKWSDEVTPPPAVKEEFVYLLEPTPPTTPSCVILFTGGAGLGTYPHIAYSELLKRTSARLNAAVIAAPYDIGLDHFEIAKKNGELLRKAVIKLEDERGYSDSLPKFMLSHSLGGKLQTLSLAATGIGQELQGIGFMSYNNFGFGSVVQQTKTFAKELQGGMSGGGRSSMGIDEEMMDGIMNFAEMAIGMVGIEFSPSPADTERIVSSKFDSELQQKTRLFVFDDDDLDSSEDFVEACKAGDGAGPSVSGLPGSHLAPVYIKLGLNDLDLPEEARDIAGEVSGGFQSASFGDEDLMQGAVNEVCDWILGKGPTRGPRRSDVGNTWSDQKRLSGGIIDAEVD